jgi:hypothetical protein
VRKSMGWIGVVVAATGLVALAAGPAGAGRNGGAAPLHVRKVVVGPVPAGTQFVETIACDGSIIVDGGGGSSSAQLVFDAQGNPVGTGDTVTFVEAGSCTVTETQTGGAATVIYECEGTAPPPNEDATGAGGPFSPLRAGVQPLPVCETTGPQSDPITVNIFTEGQEATVTVTNTFVDPGSAAAPAVAVEEVPRFTG